MKSLPPNWSSEEFSGVDLGDKRLDKRLLKVATELSNHPEFSINQACGDWDSTKAAYRFFQNDSFDENDIMRPHFKKTATRCLRHRFVVVLQDTTIVGYSHHPKTKGLGRIGGCSRAINTQHGLNMHTALAVSPEGLPLGLLSNALWCTTGRQFFRGDRIDHLIPTTEKESYKWIHALEQTYELLEARIPTITVADRECDMHDFFLSAIDLGTHFVVRNNADRNVGDRFLPKKLSQKLDESPVLGLIEIDVPAKLKSSPGKKPTKRRKAILQIKTSTVVLSPSRKLSQEVKEKVEVRVVEAKEIHPPDEFEAAHWKLFTSLNVDVLKDAIQVVRLYAMRWKIEVYFKVLKSGCTIEKCRLAEAERLKKYIVLFSVIAWRIYWLTFVKRVDPKCCSSNVFSRQEWLTLYRVANKSEVIPEKPPSTEEAILLLARLGGFLGRKNDGDPGPTALWRGWSRLQDMLTALRYGG
jgi:hypothetical protein